MKQRQTQYYYLALTGAWASAAWILFCLGYAAIATTTLATAVALGVCVGVGVLLLLMSLLEVYAESSRAPGGSAAKWQSSSQEFSG